MNGPILIFIVCETTSAIVPHMRRIQDGLPAPNYTGHYPKPAALCGVQISWDTKLPLQAVRCKMCLERYNEIIRASEQLPT